MFQGVRAKETTLQATDGNISNRNKDLVFITEGVLNSEG